MANSSGTQDLIVNILAPSQRYEVTNYGNVTIPTNLDVKDETKTQFGAFYAALFDRTVEQNPGAVITEYAWDASTCDPCPGPQLDDSDFYTLGADVLGGDYYGLVLTRLHARYGKSDMKADLVFKAAEPIVGGREFLQDSGKLEERSRPDATNNFQARYAIRHEWTGAVTCKDPVRGRWGGPPDDQIAESEPQSATNIAFAPRGTVSLPALVKQDIPEIGVQAGVPLPGTVNKASYPGCTCSTSTGAAGGVAFAGGAGAVLALVLRRRRR
jgi:MYXO-CTERM domain-containing protein